MSPSNVSPTCHAIPTPEPVAFVEELGEAYRAALQNRPMRVAGHAHTLIGDDPDGIDAVISEVRRRLGAPKNDAEVRATVHVVIHVLRQAAGLLFRHGRHEEALTRERLVYRIAGKHSELEPTLVSVQSVAAHARRTKCRHRVVREARAVENESPDFFGRDPLGPPRESELPQVVVAELKNVAVRGRSEAISVSRDRTLHDVAPLDREGRWAHSDFLHHDTDRAIEMRSKSRSDGVKIRKGILLTGTSSDNYYHFLTEVLPKLATLADDPPPPGVPLLVDAEAIAVPQLAELLNRVSGGRPYKAIPRGELVRVKHLVTPSAVTWMPTNLAPGATFRASDQRVDPASLAFVRSELLQARAGRAPVRLFVRRGRTPRRRLLNEDALVRIAEARGFVAVSPGDLDLETQLDLFSRAEAIVGPAGGGMANVTFAPAGARVLVMMSRAYDFSLFHTVSTALSHRVLHLSGQAKPDTGVIALHDDYAVEQASFTAALDSLGL